jgi:hypothetical protein
MATGLAPSKSLRRSRSLARFLNGVNVDLHEVQGGWKSCQPWSRSFMCSCEVAVVIAQKCAPREGEKRLELYRP